MFKNRKGFSLVELIVVIAILAVLVAVLAPSLIRYTENSRAQKDVSAMDELVNAVQLSLANDKCFDEALEYSVENNFITYTDSSAEYGKQMADEEFYAPDGWGKATTITFNPEIREDGKTIYRLSSALVNDMTYGNGSVAKDRTMEGAKISDNQCNFSEMNLLYNSVRLTVGDTLRPTSTTYRNSSFTVFIKFSQKDGITVAEVSGAFNGTNLHEGCFAAKGSGTESYTTDGEAITSVDDPGHVNAEYGNTDFSGGASSNLPAYKTESYISNMQRDNECEYYSTLKAAIDDANNAFSTGGDSDKNSAAAFAYTKSGEVFVVLLKDHEVTSTINVTSSMTLVLGGKKVTGRNLIIIHVPTGSQTLTIDGRIASSAMEVFATEANGFYAACYNEAGLMLNGGTYAVHSSNDNAVLCTITSSLYSHINSMTNLTVTADGTAAQMYAVQAGNQSFIENCTITVNNEKAAATTPTKLSVAETSAVIAATADKVVLKNCTITAIGSEGKCLNSDGSVAKYRTTGVTTDKVSLWEITNCKIVGSSAAVAATSGKAKDEIVKIYNCELIGGVSAIYQQQSSESTYQHNVYLEKCTLRSDNTLIVDAKADYGPEIVRVMRGTMYMHDCAWTSNHPTRMVLLRDKAVVKMSQTDSSVASITVNSECKLYIGARNTLKTPIQENGTTIFLTNEIYK